MTQQDQLLSLSLGQLLYNTRKDQKISIDEVSRSLKLRRKLIRSMEDDCWDNLASVYSKGFARRYAEFLQIPAAEYQSALAEINTHVPPVKSVFSKNINDSSASLKSFRVLSYLLASVFVVLPLILAYTHFAVRWSQNEPLLSQSITQPGVKSHQATEPKIFNSESQTGHLQANMISIPILSEQNAQPAIGRVLGDLANLLELELSADSWISVIDANGLKLESRLLEGGQSYQYSGTPPYNVQLGRASAVKVELGGTKINLGPISGNDVVDIEVGKQILN